MRSPLVFLSIVACFSLAGAACKDGADHGVICTQAKIRRVNADKGTPNDRQQRCHGMTQKHILTAPNADHAAYADCVLEAESEAAAAQCK